MVGFCHGGNLPAGHDIIDDMIFDDGDDITEDMIFYDDDDSDTKCREE